MYFPLIMKKFNFSPFGLAFVGILCFYGFIFSFFTIRTGLDDLQMSSITAGFFLNQTPSEFMLFSNVLIGHLLKFLTLRFPNFAWYDFYLLISLFVAHFVILYVFIYQKSKNSLFLGLIFFAIAFYSVVNMFFTVVGAYVSFAGIILYFHIFLQAKSKKITWGFSILLIIWGSCIRFHSCLLMLILCLPMGGYWAYFQGKIIQKKLGLTIAVLLISFAGVFLLKYYDSAYYDSNPAWKNHREHIGYLVSILDYDQLPFSPYQDIYAQNQWSKNDCSMLRSWFFTDEKVFGLAQFRQLMHHHSVYTLKFVRQRGVWYVLSRLRDTYTSSHAILAYVSWVVILMIGQFQNKIILLSSVSFGFIFLLFLYLAYFMKITEYHITYILFSFWILGLCFVLANAEFRPKRIFILGGFILMMLFLSIKENHTHSQINEKGVQGFQQLMASLQRNKLYIFWDISPSYVSGIFLGNPQKIKNIDLIHLGHCSYPALIQETLKKYHISNIHEDIIDHPDVILVSKNQKNEFYKQYMKEHYARAIAFDFLEEKHQLRFYRVIEHPQNPSELPQTSSK